MDLVNLCSKLKKGTVYLKDDYEDIVLRRGCVKMYTSSFYAQIPDFLKPGLCYFLKFLYL